MRSISDAVCQTVVSFWILTSCHRVTSGRLSVQKTKTEVFCDDSDQSPVRTSTLTADSNLSLGLEVHYCSFLPLRPQPANAEDLICRTSGAGGEGRPLEEPNEPRHVLRISQTNAKRGQPVTTGRYTCRWPRLTMSAAKTASCGSCVAAVEASSSCHSLPCLSQLRVLCTVCIFVALWAALARSARMGYLSKM